MAEIEKIDLGSNQLVTFRLAGEELALPIKSVQEIIKMPEITSVQLILYFSSFINMR